MDSWESTLIVLKDAEAFHTYFSLSPLLTEPKLLFELNSAGFVRKSVTSTIDAGASLVNDAISGIRRDLTDFRKEQLENNNLVQRQVASIHANMESQTNAVALIGNQLQQFDLALLAGRDEKANESRISVIDNNLAFEVQSLRYEDDKEEKLIIKRNIKSLKSQRHEQAALLASAADNTMRLIGLPPACLSLHQPPITPLIHSLPLLPVLIHLLILCHKPLNRQNKVKCHFPINLCQHVNRSPVLLPQPLANQ